MILNRCSSQLECPTIYLVIAKKYKYFPTFFIVFNTEKRNLSYSTKIQILSCVKAVQCVDDVSPKLTLSNSSKASLNSALRSSSKLEPILQDKARERIYNLYVYAGF